MRLATDIVSAIAALIIVWWSIGWIVNTYQLGRATILLGMQYWIWQIILPVGMLLFALETILEAVALVKKGSPPSPANLESVPASQTL
jgi:TRAP-type C4-dicarboxylate transport system permease small subunit